jgi:long-chain acyl-CoA synthetase
MRNHLASLLDDFRRLGDEVAVVRYQGNRRRVTTYGELARLAGRFAALLERRGIRPGDRVLLWAENSAEWIAAFHGCLLRGVLAVPLDANGTAEFALRVAADVKPRMAVGDALLLRQLFPGSQDRDVGHSSTGSPFLSGKSSAKNGTRTESPSHPGRQNNGAATMGHPASGQLFPGSQNGNHGRPVPEHPDFQRLAFEDWHAELPAEEIGAVAGLSRETPLEILFTSGTTGDPKGIVLTHGNVLASVGPIEDGARRYMRYEWLIHPLRILHTLPLSHVFGQTMGLWIPSILKAELHFESRPAAPRLIQLIKEERISVLAAVPRVLALMKAHLEMNDPALAARVEQSRGIGPLKRWWRFRAVHRAFGLKFWAFVSGGGALASPLEQFWSALGFVLVQGYGMTETTALITLNHPFHVAKGTIGKPLAGRDVKLGPDGEVLVRGPMISGAVWQGGELKQRQDEWLATGDLAERQESGELKFLGRKSEVIVTASGVNLHPEDMEAAVEEQPGVAACAVVAMETAEGPEPCAVLAVRGAGDQAAKAIEGANAHLAEFQRVRRWVLWPEPDLPRTSTGKVRRKAVAAWLTQIQTAANGASANGAPTNGAPANGTSANGVSAIGTGAHRNGSAAANHDGQHAFAASSDWLAALIAQITGEQRTSAGDELRLTEDLHLDSLGRVQLSAAIEQRLGIVSGSGLLEEVQTMGDLRRLVAGDAGSGADEPSPTLSPDRGSRHGSLAGADGDQRGKNGARGGSEDGNPLDGALGVNGPRGRGTIEQAELNGGAIPRPLPQAEAPRPRFIYPEWPWWKPVEWVRIAFIEAVMRPLVWLLANPRVVGPQKPLPEGPMLIVANHVTAFDGPLVQYAVAGRVRRHIAAAMLGEMLEDYRHWRNPERAPGSNGFYLPGPAAYFLVTALFNVFPLPRQRDFQTSFAHAGKAMDRGYSVLVFPEGTRSAEGELARFRPGIGLLAKQSGVPVLPIGIRGLGDLKAHRRGWFRSGTVEVRVGEAIQFEPDETEGAITARLHAEVEKLLTA